MNKHCKPTRAQIVLGRLLKGRATALQLMQAGGGMRVGARIWDLRRRGHRILGPQTWTRRDGTLERKVLTPVAGWDVYELHR